jgi:hypothetical protein
MDKTNILLIVIVILVLVAIFYGKFIFTIEPFQASPYESQSPTDEESETDKIYGCKFMPWGPTIDSCVNNCMTVKRVGLWDIDGNQCNEEICRQKCGLCTNELSCQWISSWSKEEKQKMLHITEEDTTISKLVPRKLTISGISFPDTEFSTVYDDRVNIKISWENYGDNKTFMAHYYNMKRRDNMIRVDTIDNPESTELTIQNLDKNTEYSVIVYSINDYGVSKPSNIIVVET